MQIMAVSDRILEHLYEENVGRKYRGIDLLIGCGDLPYYYLEFLMSALDTRLVYVRGNHDNGPQYTSDGRVLMDVPGGINIHGQSLHLEGLLIAGLEGSIRYRPNVPFMYTEREMTSQVMQLIPQLLWNRARHGRALDILVTHSPPFGIHDQKDAAHRGFRIFLSLMKRFRPRYLLHGHIHVYRPDIQRVTRYHETTVINVYPYHIFEFGTL